MGALDRVKKNSRGQIMMPSNVSGGGYQEGASIKQAVSACGMLLFTLVSIISFSDKRAASHFTGWIPLILLLIFMWQFVIRYLIIDERYLIKQTSLIDKALDKVPAQLWEVINIDDDGVIYYQDGRLGVIIEAEQATVIGRDSQFRGKHYSAISDFYKILNQNNIQWTHINAMISAKAENRLNAVNKELDKCKNANIKKMCDMHLTYLRSIEVRTLYEREHWGLIVRPSFGKEKLLETVMQAISCLESAAFNRASILTREQCYNLNTELEALTAFDASTLMIERAQKLAGAPIARLVQVKVVTGTLSPNKVEAANSLGRIYQDSSAYVGTVEHITTLTIGNKLANIITSRLQVLIKNKQPLAKEEFLSNIIGISTIEKMNLTRQAKQNKKKPAAVDTPVEPKVTEASSEEKVVQPVSSEPIILFDDTYDNLTPEEAAELMRDEAERAMEANKQVYTFEEAEKLSQKEPKKHSAKDRKKENERLIAERAAAIQAEKEAKEAEERRKVSFNDFDED